jgi:antitoxin component of RelBE/YafQ-DinJ toxin-antitoxin module
MKDTTTIRMERELKKGIAEFAKKWGLSFSDVINILARALLDRRIFFGAFQLPPEEIEYPPGFIDDLEKSAEETHRLYKEGKIKGYTDADEAVAALLKEAEECE